MDDNIKDIVDFLDEEIKERSKHLISASNNNLGSSGASMNITSSQFRKAKDPAEKSSKKKADFSQNILEEPSEFSRKQLSEQNSVLNESILSKSHKEVSREKQGPAMPLSVSGSNSLANFSVKKSSLGQHKYQLSTAITTPTNTKPGHSAQKSLLQVAGRLQQPSAAKTVKSQLNSRLPSPSTNAVKLPSLSRGPSKEKPQDPKSRKAA